MECGVDSTHYKEYQFEDHLYYRRGHYDLLSLAKYCVNIDGDFYVRNIDNNSWNVRRNTVAKKDLINQLADRRIPLFSPVDAEEDEMGEPVKRSIEVTTELIDQFFDGIRSTPVITGNNRQRAVIDKEVVGNYPILDGTVNIPLGPEFVTMNGMRFLNIWQNSFVASDSSPESVALALTVLRMIYRSLLNSPEIAADAREESQRLLDVIIDPQLFWSDQFKDFRFCMIWLATLRQRPGANLGTNIWFIAEQGVGKSTLVEILRRMLGPGNCGKLSQEEVERGWNDHVVNKLLIEADEFDSHGRRESERKWDKWLKQNCNETMITICARNRTAYTTVNTTNYIFTTNEINPISVDNGARRHQIFQGSSDVSRWSPWATQIRELLNDEQRAIKLVGGFAWILEQVVLDDRARRFVINSYDTDVRRSMSVDSADPIRAWLANGTIDWDPERWQAANDLYDDFLVWMSTNYPSDARPNIVQFGRTLSLIGRNGYYKIERKRSNTKSLYRMCGLRDQAMSREITTEIAQEFQRVAGASHDVADESLPQDLPDTRPLTKKERIRQRLLRGGM